MNEEFEKEMDMPEGWQSNLIFVRDGRGNVIQLEIPDDDTEEMNGNATND